MLWQSELERLLPESCHFDFPLSDLNSWGVGGRAECVIAPTTPEALPLIFRFANSRNLALWFLGGGTNVLIPDNGLCGITIHTCKMDSIEEERDPGGSECLLTCGAGVLLRDLLHLSLMQGFTGLEFAAGIPGTLGGALIGNAGASGKGIGNIVNWVETVEPDGNCKTWYGNELQFSYRKSNLNCPRRLVSRCEIVVDSAPREEIGAGIRDQILLRAGQPHGVKTAGCVFKNPGTLFAGELLEKSGCKSLSCGPVIVSPDHANFFINRGQGKASDILELILQCREKVLACTGIHLELEVKLLGESWQ